MSTSTLIGLHGGIGAGKDTVAEELVNQHGYWRQSFAGPLKDMLIAGLGLQRDAFTDRERKEQPVDWLGKSPRDLMRTLGTEWGRNLVRDDLWILHMARRIQTIQTAMKNTAHIVITDVRYPNEADFVRSAGGTIWHIARVTGNGSAVHSSDVPLFPKAGDSIVSNNGTLEELHAEIASALLGNCKVQT